MLREKKNKDLKILNDLIQRKKELVREICYLKNKQKLYNRIHVNTKIHKHQIKYYLTHNSKITSYDITTEICPEISARTARRLLHKLYLKGKIQKHKHGQTIYYTSNSN